MWKPNERALKGSWLHDASKGLLSALLSSGVCVWFHFPLALECVPAHKVKTPYLPSGGYVLTLLML